MCVREGAIVGGPGPSPGPDICHLAARGSCPGPAWQTINETDCLWICDHTPGPEGERGL